MPVNPSTFGKFVSASCSSPQWLNETGGKATITLDNLIPSRVRLTESPNVQALMIDEPSYKNFRNCDLEYSCDNYWSLNEFNKTEEDSVEVQVFSDVISEGFFGEGSIMAFYLGTTFAVGTMLRVILVYKADRIFILDGRDPRLIRNLMDCLYRQRLEGNLKKEEELFFLLFEILRSPELYKHLTGSSLRGQIEEAAQKAFA